MSFIFTDAEYEVAKTCVAKSVENFEAERAKLAEAGHDEAAQKMLQTTGYTRLQMQKEEIEIYENLKAGKLPESFEVTRLPRMLTCMRIASGLSQEQLAEKLHQSLERLKREERNEYHGVSSRWAQKVIDALPVKVTIVAKDSETGEELRCGEVGELRNIVESLQLLDNVVHVVKSHEQDYNGQFGMTMGYAVFVTASMKVRLTVKCVLTK